ncbi:MAG TPA: glycosyltransferase [Acetobacteraceae bacterium]|nr:glycosyltransferase [Acetobacteraceae bacterium]
MELTDSRALAAPPISVRHVAGAERPPWAAYDVDVVILALDRAEATVAAIRSALNQIGVSRYVIVVDQGSRPDALTCLALAVQGRDDATLVVLDRNYGVPGGRNIGSGLGSGRHIVGLDNDAEFAAPDTLARLTAGLDADPELAAIGCRIVADATGEDDLSSWGYPPALLPRSQETFDTATFVGAGHAIRRAAWKDVGGYDARLFFCWEEYDFCLRAIARYWRVRYRGDIVVRHKVSPERRVAWSGDRWFHFVRNRIYIGRKSGESWLALAPRIAGYCLKAAYNGCLHETPGALWAAFRMARGVRPVPLHRSARHYLQRTDTAWRGSWFARLRRDVLAALPGTSRRSAQATDASIRAIRSADSGPASAAATHSASS